MPGEWHVGKPPGVLRTLLGSCVAVTLWHPARRVGGMCHYLLPGRQRASDAALEGRFGNEALALMVRALESRDIPVAGCVAHLYGGADTMPGASGPKFNIGQRNIEEGWRLIDHYGIELRGVDVGDTVPRVVTLDLSSGDVQMRRGGEPAAVR